MQTQKHNTTLSRVHDPEFVHAVLQPLHDPGAVLPALRRQRQVLGEGSLASL